MRRSYEDSYKQSADSYKQGGDSYKKSDDSYKQPAQYGQDKPSYDDKYKDDKYKDDKYKDDKYKDDPTYGSGQNKWGKSYDDCVSSTLPYV